MATFNFQPKTVSGVGTVYVNQTASAIPDAVYGYTVTIENNTRTDFNIPIQGDTYSFWKRDTTSYTFDLNEYEKSDIDTDLANYLGSHSSSDYTLTTEAGFVINRTKFCWVGSKTANSSVYTNSTHSSVYAQYPIIQFGYSNTPNPTSSSSLIPIITQIGHACMNFAGPGAYEHTTGSDCNWVQIPFTQGTASDCKRLVSSYDYNDSSSLAIKIRDDMWADDYAAHLDIISDTSTNEATWTLSGNISDPRISSYGGTYKQYTKSFARTAYFPAPASTTYDKWTFSTFLTDDAIMKFMNSGYVYLYATPVFEDYDYFTSTTMAAASLDDLNSYGMGWISEGKAFTGSKVCRGGSWRDIKSAKVYVNGAWKNVTAMKVYQGGSWKDVPSTSAPVSY